MEFEAITLDKIVPPSPSGLADTQLLQKRDRPKANKLSVTTKELIQKLQGRVELATLPEQFPSVLNRIALCWGVPSDLYPLLDGFLVDDRGNRQGFPFKALKELSELLEHHEMYVAPRKLNTFNKR
jgi:hypothetical protein